MTIRPLHDKILVRIPSAKEIKRQSGLILPANVVANLDQSTLEALVIAVGKGKRLKNGTYRALEIEPGDRLLVAKYAGTRLHVEDKLHMLIVEKDIVALLPDTP